MANLFNNMKPKSNPTKNGFDLSERHTYSARAGMLYPVMTKEVVPGDYFEIDLASMSRTQTLVAPSFARVKQYHHFFFVPYNSLWHGWDEFYTQRLDPTHFPQKQPLYAPTFSLPGLIWNWKNGAGANDYTCNNATSGYHLMRYIADMLGYGDFDQIKTYLNQSIINDPTCLRCNAFRILAYNKIFADYYRNHYRDNTDYSSLYNVDDVQGDTLANSYIESTNTHNITKMFLPKFRGWTKDIFMGSMPTMQFGDVSVMSSGASLLITNTAPTAASGQNASLLNVSNKLYLGLRDSGGSAVSTSASNWQLNNLFDVLALRKAEKLQEWKQKTLMAGNRINSQYIAHFGRAPFRENDHANFIGGFESYITIDEVTQTTGHTTVGEDNELGQLAGKGIGVTQGKKIKYKVSDFGIIMCIVSFVPELEYDGNWLDKNNTLFEQFDWLTPEFENLGLAPVTKKDLSMKTDFTGDAATPSTLLANLNRVLGYAPAYWWYKTAVDRCHIDLSSYGTQSYYSTPRVDIETGRTLNLQDFYINPNVLDSIFGTEIDSRIVTDQFICVSSFDVKAIRPMSVLGLPSF